MFPPFSASGCSYPDKEQLQTIYSVYLQPVLQRSLGSQAVWASAGKTHQLAGSLVEIYEQVWTPAGVLLYSNFCPFYLRFCFYLRWL